MPSHFHLSLYLWCHSANLRFGQLCHDPFWKPDFYSQRFQLTLKEKTLFSSDLQFLKRRQTSNGGWNLSQKISLKISVEMKKDTFLEFGLCCPFNLILLTWKLLKRRSSWSSNMIKKTDIFQSFTWSNGTSLIWGFNFMIVWHLRNGFRKVIILFRYIHKRI